MINPKDVGMILKELNADYCEMIGVSIKNNLVIQ